MATKSSTKDTTLTLSRTFHAKREAVFKAWTDPQALMRWFAPSDDFSVPLAEVDLRVGGQYRLQMKSPKGDLYTLKGTYREVVVPEKLVFTWFWSGGCHCGSAGFVPEHETLVTVELREHGASTEVLLIHEYFMSEAERDDHCDGWSGCLNRLPQAL